MSCKAIFLTFFILLAVSTQALAGRDIPKTDDKKNVDVKQSDFFFKSWFPYPSSPDNSVLIPGVGRIMVPPGKSFPQYDPYSHARARSYPPYTGYTGSYPYSGGNPTGSSPYSGGIPTGSTPYSGGTPTGSSPYSGGIPTGSTPYSGGSPNYIPGGDDTLLPNPGVEAPVPRVGAAPAKAQLTKAQPGKTQPAKAQPAKTQPAKAQPTQAQPGKTQPAKAQPAKTQPAKAQPTKAQPAKAQP